MDIKRNGSRPSRTGPAEYFTGAVRIDDLIDAAAAYHFVGPRNMIAARPLR